MTIDLAKTDTPIVKVDICLARKDEDENGLPDFVERFIFYPHEEALKLIATHCLGTEIKSWSKADYTCFTVSMAGTSGFLQILPIILNLILFPYMRTEDLLAQVHPKNVDGEDSSTIWTFHNGFNSHWSMMGSLFELLYPGKSGYHNPGVLQQMRNSKTNEKILDYHKKFYRAENIVLIISGKINQHQIFKRFLKK